MSDNVTYSAKAPNFVDPEGQSKKGDLRLDVEVFERDIWVGIRLANGEDKTVKALVLHPDEAEDLIAGLKKAISESRAKIKDSGNSPPKLVERVV